MIGLPTIHLNGTGARTLLAGYDQAYDALHAFQNVMREIEFNARDYYVNGPQSWEAACEARCEINLKIKDIEAYITIHMMHIQDQIK